MSNRSDETEVEPEGRLMHVGFRKDGLRAHNERLILSLLRSHGPSAKAQIAQMTGLSAQTASVIMRQLEAQGLIERCAPVRGKVGQPSVPMQLAPKGALFFGLKIGRRSADLVLVDFLGTILDRKHLIYPYPDPGETLRFAQSAVKELVDGLDAKLQDRVAGLGIAIPGYLWEWAKIIGVPSAKMAAWRDRDIREEIAAMFDFPVFLQNDASCACGAELVFGQRDYPAEFLYFYIGHLIGGGVVLNGELFTGPTGNAGALGPLPVPSDGRGLRQLVDVGSLSCLEEEIRNSGGDAATLWESATAWSVDDEILDRWLDQTAHGLAYAIAAACSIIDFGLVAIDGWLPQHVRRDLVERAKVALPEMNWAGLFVPELCEGTIGPDARALGAASLPLSQRFLASLKAY